MLCMLGVLMLCMLGVPMLFMLGVLMLCMLGVPKCVCWVYAGYMLGVLLLFIK